MAQGSRRFHSRDGKRVAGGPTLRGVRLEIPSAIQRSECKGLVGRDESRRSTQEPAGQQYKKIRVLLTSIERI